MNTIRPIDISRGFVALTQVTMRRFVIVLLFGFMALFVESRLEASDSVPNVLGRFFRVNELCADFENKNWLDDYNRGDDYWHDVRSDYKRGPESLRRVATPAIGNGALEISRINDTKQQEMLSPAFSMKVRNLRREDKPVFVVRVWLPPFDQWGEAYGFGFRQQTHASNITYLSDSKYSTSIWVKKDERGIRFYFRAADGQDGDVPGGPIVEPGWWTLAVAFDDNGIGHYYISHGTSNPTEKNEVFKTTQFPAPNNPLMDDVEYSYFAISEGNSSPRFVIDAYEVWTSSRVVAPKGSDTNV